MKKRLPETKNKKRLQLRSLDKEQLTNAVGGGEMDPSPTRMR